MVGGEMDRDPEWGDEGTSCPFPNPGEQLAPWTSCEKLQGEPVTGQEAQMKIRKDHPGSSERPTDHGRCLFISEAERDLTQKRGRSGDSGGRACSDAGSSQGILQPQKPRGTKDRFSPSVSGGSTALPAPPGQSCDLQNWTVIVTLSCHHTVTSE